MKTKTDFLPTSSIESITFGKKIWFIKKRGVTDLLRFSLCPARSHAFILDGQPVDAQYVAQSPEHAPLLGEVLAVLKAGSFARGAPSARSGKRMSRQKRR